MPIITIKPAFETGIEALDQGHQELADLINALETASLAGAGITRLSALLKRIRASVANHFAQEDRLLETPGVSEAHRLEHRSEHAGLNSRLAGIDHNWLKTPDNVRELSAYLNHWFTRHTLETDQTLASELQQHPLPTRLHTTLDAYSRSLQETRERLRALVESIPNLLWLSFDANETPLYTPLWLSLCQAPPREVGVWQNAMPPDDLANWQALTGHARQHAMPYQIEYRLRDIDGHLHHIFEQGNPYKIGDRHTLLILCTELSGLRDSEAQRVGLQSGLERCQRVLGLLSELLALVTRPTAPDTLLKSIAKRLPGAMSRPDESGVAVRFLDKRFVKGRQINAPFTMSTPLTMNGQLCGHFEMGFASGGDSLSADGFSETDLLLFQGVTRLVQLFLQREGEQAAHRHETAGWHALLDTDPAPVLLASPSGTVRYANPAAHALQPGPLLHMDTLLAWQGHDAFRQLTLRQETQESRLFPFTPGPATQDNEAYSVSVLRLDQDTFFLRLHPVSTLSDMQWQLDAAESRFCAVMEAAAEGIAIVEPDTLSILRCNPALVEMTGYRQDALESMRFTDLQPTCTASVLDGLSQPLADGTMPVSRELSLQHQRGLPLSGEVRARKIHWNAQNVLLVTLKDVTDQQESTALLRRHINIQSFLGDLASRLANEPVSTLWERLEECLEACGRFLGADRTLLYLREDDDLLLTHQWSGETLDDINIVIPPIPRQQWGELERPLSDGGRMIDSDAPLPEGYAPLFPFLTNAGHHSLMLAPLVNDKRFLGLIAVYCENGPTPWLWMERRMLQSCADMLGTTLAHYYQTLQLEAEQQLRASQPERDAPLHWEWDIAANNLFWTDATPEQSAYLPATIESWVAATAAEDQARFENALRSTLTHGTTLNVSLRQRGESGQWECITVMAVVECDTEGIPRRLIGHVGSTHHQLIEQKLRQSAAVMMQSREGIMITDTRRCIIEVNEAFTRITGYPRDEVIGRTPAILHSGRQDTAFYQSLWQTLTTSGSWRGILWNRRKNGEIYPEYLSIAAVRNGARQISHYVGVFSDVGDITLSDLPQETLLHYDPLTQLPNRLLFNVNLHSALSRQHGTSQRTGLVIVDLDAFSRFNHSGGHPVGDQLLENVARRLETCIQRGNLLARAGMDTFMILVEGLHAEAPLMRLATRIDAALSHPFTIGKEHYSLSASQGIAISTPGSGTRQTLLADATFALAQAKSQGGARYCFHNEAMTRRSAARRQRELDLRQALDRNEISLVFQPVFSLGDRRIIGSEVQLRWQHPLEGEIPADSFLALAEETGLIVPLEEWLITEACERFQKWRSRGLKPGCLFATLSESLLIRADFSHRLGQLLTRLALPGDCLVLDSGESLPARSRPALDSTLKSLGNLGVLLAFKVAGGGLLSLSRLHDLPFTMVKLASCHTRQLDYDGREAAMVRGITALARELDMVVIAEGVDSQGQIEALQHSGCLLGQGAALQAPLSAVELEEQLRKQEAGIPAPGTSM